METIIITILIYSFINTALCFYKDASPYSHGLEWTDVAMGGPVLWLILLVRATIMAIFGKKKINAALRKRQLNKKPKIYSEKKVQKIIEKVMKIAKKQDKGDNDYFLLTQWHTFVDGNEYFGADALICCHKEKYQWILKKFGTIYMNQYELAIAEMKKYMTPVTEEVMRKDGMSEYYISQYKNIGLMKF